MDLSDIRKAFGKLRDEYGLTFQHEPAKAGKELERLVDQAFIAGLRKANLQLQKRLSKIEKAAGLMRAYEYYQEEHRDGLDLYDEYWEEYYPQVNKQPPAL